MFVIRRLSAEAQPVIERLWQLYRHDLSEFRGSHGPSGVRGTLPDEDGLFALRTLLPFLADDPDRAAYLFYDDARPVGFALVTGVASEPRLMSEFFVVRGMRRHGVGRDAVRELFALHPGAWEIPFQESNVAAARFWREIAASVAGNGFREEQRPVPGKPEVPPDVWIRLTVA
jgi:predicted acetyltransferase